nr:anaerobic ribonucleoside-triphosphate reductase activating protein [Paenibacillus sophorae]
MKTDDMNNGSGLRVVVFLSGCEHMCHLCHNKQTWNPCSGILFDETAKNKIFECLNKEYIDGITWSGGDPLHQNNIEEVVNLSKEIKAKYPNKTIWLYSGYKYEWIQKNYPDILQFIDVLVDGKFIQKLSDVNYHWAGSTNQEVIDIQESLKQYKKILLNQLYK